MMLMARGMEWSVANSDNGFSVGMRCEGRLETPSAACEITNMQSAHGNTAILWTGCPAQYSIMDASPRRRVIASALKAVWYR